MKIKKTLFIVLCGIAACPNLFADDMSTARNMTAEQRIAVIEQWQTKTEAEKWQKEGLLNEARGDWKGAVAAYKQMLTQPVSDKMVIGGTHIAFQRAYYELGDTDNEKQELKWISDNILSDLGEYHFLLSYLEPSAISIIKSRIENYPEDDISKLVQLTKKNASESGDRLNIKQAGNFVFVGPMYYEKGETPISSIERKVYDEYIARMKTATSEAAGIDRDKQYSIVQDIVRKYKTTEENLMSLIAKIAYNEVVPGNYQPPSEL